MADYTDLPNTAVGVGGIPSGTTVTALRDNPIAIAERAAGAPKVLGANYDIISRTVISGSPATVDFLFAPADYDAVFFELGNVVPVTDAVFLLARLSDNGSTFVSSSSAYRHHALAQRSTSQTLTASTGDTAIALTPSYTIGSAAGEDGVSGVLSVFNPALTARTLLQWSLSHTDLATILVSHSGSAQRTAATNTQGVQFLLSSGNFESGVITMYGVRNS